MSPSALRLLPAFFAAVLLHGLVLWSGGFFSPREEESLQSHRLTVHLNPGQIPGTKKSPVADPAEKPDLAAPHAPPLETEHSLELPITSDPTGSSAIDGAPGIPAEQGTGPASPDGLNPPNRTVADPLPVYPLLARRNGLEGLVQVEVTVGSDGVPREAKVLRSSGHRILDKAVVETILTLWRFHPGVEFTTLKEFEFQLKKGVSTSKG